MAVCVCPVVCVGVGSGHALVEILGVFCVWPCMEVFGMVDL